MRMAKSITRTIGVLGVAGLLALLNSQAAVAQSTIFNIPSTDVVPKKKVYLEFDFLSHFESHEDGGFQTYVPRAVVGVGKGVEVGDQCVRFRCFCSGPTRLRFTKREVAVLRQ